MEEFRIIKIRKIAFTKLRKLEVYSFFNEVVSVIKESNTEGMHIGDTCDILMAKQPQAKLLKPTERDRGPHWLTPEVDKLHEGRLKFAAIITNQMRILERADLADERQLVSLTKPIVYHYLNYLRENDKDTIDSRISGFFYELKHKSEVKDALYQLGFKTYLDELDAANKEHENTRAERATQLSQRPKGSTLPLQRELQYIMSILFEQVDYFQHVYKDVDYSKLITSLNHTIATYTKLIKTRDTQRKHKKLKAEKDAQAALEGKNQIKKVEEKHSSAVADINAKEAVSTTGEKEKESSKQPVVTNGGMGEDKQEYGTLGKNARSQGRKSSN